MDRDTQVRPDRETRVDGRLDYAEVFNPSILPFKRMNVFDAVGNDYVLRVHDKHLRHVPVGGAASADRDLFWGSLLLELRPGEDVAIPSVAPDMRVLSYETEPAANLVFSKDGADSYYVRAEGLRVETRLRLVFLVDAPASYFSSAIPRGLRIDEATASDLVRPVPPRAHRAVLAMLPSLNVTAALPLHVVIDRLVDAFRSFEVGALASVSDDIYVDLTTSRRGACRHRAFAFIVTANALGIPARYVSNEAHAFVEIWVPGVGWIRVDLGGAALELGVANAAGKAMHHPRNPDPFPKPPSFARSYSRLGGVVHGLSEAQRAASRAHAGESDPSTSFSTGSREEELPRVTPSDLVGKVRSRLIVESSDPHGYVGETLGVTGQLMAEDPAAAASIQVYLYLAKAHRAGRSARLIGHVLTDDHGRFSVELTVPIDMPYGPHEVVAATPGSERLAPAVSGER